jgi:hypothetical protein
MVQVPAILRVVELTLDEAQQIATGGRRHGRMMWRPT